MSVDSKERAVNAFASFVLAHSRLMNEIEASMGEGELGLDLYDVLVTLEVAEGRRLRFSDLADRIVLSKSGLTRRVDRLVRLGYVKREACSEDRRVGYAVLTEEGLRARERAWPALRDTIHRFFASRMTDGEARQLETLMRRIADGIDREKCRELTRS